jgi:NTP pyrophosphatase (non-canonical NTP hydrolase)
MVIVRRPSVSNPDWKTSTTDFIPDDGFVAVCQMVGFKIHELHKRQGFWDREQNMKEVALKIAHMHSELSEAYECARHGGKRPDKNILNYTGLEVQLADVLGILLDLTIAHGLRIPEALLHKMEFNKTREYLHGKEF